MTARQHIRVGRRLGRDRTAVDATAAPSVGDLLHAAREKKGVDLYRAERDTKIRARHLAALESGEYGELPGAVYVKGFLRNYAVYLGLDATEVLERWHEEQDPHQKAAAAAVVGVPPQPLEDPRRGLTVTPGVIVAAILTVLVVGFLGYVGLQLARFSQSPELSLAGEAVIDAPMGTTQVTISGSAPFLATVDAIDGSGKPAGSTTADDQGAWALDLAVRRGRNDFTLTTRDPETGRDAPPRQVMVMVAVPMASTPPATPAPTAFVIGPGSDPSSPPVDASDDPAASGSPEDVPSVEGAARLEITSPAADTTSKRAAVTVQGTTDAKAVRITTTWQGNGKRPGDPGTVEVAVKRGAFSRDIALAPGAWRITTRTVATDTLASTEVSRDIRVDYKGFVVEVGPKAGASAWIQIWVDGAPIDAGRTQRNGEMRIVTAKDTVVVVTGRERVTLIGVQGDRPSVVGENTGKGTWRIDKGKAPTRYLAR